MAKHGLEGLRKSVPGPAPQRSTEDKRIEQLEKENDRLRHQLEVKDGCLMLHANGATPSQKLHLRPKLLP
jgi:hypothetical protein